MAAAPAATFPVRDPVHPMGLDSRMHGETDWITPTVEMASIIYH